MTSNLRRRLAVTLIFAAAVSATGIDTAIAQNASALAAVSSAPLALSPVDYDFVAQANLGSPFQVDSGRLAEEKGYDRGNPRLRPPVPVVDALNDPAAQGYPGALLRAAYNTTIASLKIERDAAFDRDHVDGQVEYQKGNTALFQGEIENGNDLELKAFARQTLPKTQDHLQRALKLAEYAKPGTAAE